VSDSIQEVPGSDCGDILFRWVLIVFFIPSRYIVLYTLFYTVLKVGITDSPAAIHMHNT